MIVRFRLSASGVLAMLACALVPAAGCTESHSGAAAAVRPAELPVKQLRLTEARVEPWPVTVRVQGSLLADEEATIGSKLAGRVETLHVDLGAVVQQGQPLATLDRRELELRVQQAEAMLEQASAAIGKTPADDETQLDLANSPPVMLERALIDEAKAAVARADRLRPSNAITDAEYETFTAQLKTAEARYLSARNGVREQISLIGVRRADLALAKQQLADAEVVAPFDAMVAARRVSPGAYVQVGQAVVELVRIDRLRFTAGVPESSAGDIATGQQVTIHVAGIDDPIVAQVSRLSPMVMQSSRSVRLEADVPNADLALQAGLFGEAEITVDESATTLAVPTSAVTQFAGVQKVWLVRDGKATQVTVQTGRRVSERVEILDGLEPGATIVQNADEGHEGPVAAIANGIES